MIMKGTHTPVLLQESIDALAIQEGGKYIDATYGLGGHSRAILERGGHVLGIDLDGSSLKQQEGADKLILAQGNYADIEEIARSKGFDKVDGVLFDLGLSMWQIRESGRGFSYEQASDSDPLDMRISSDTSAPGLTAAEIINSYTIEQLYDVIAKNSEEINSRSLVRAIHEFRRVRPILTVADLKEALSSITKSVGTQARVFQALRMEVNKELENIEKGVIGAYTLLKESGRIVIISFHSTEDRLIKKLIAKNGYRTVGKPLKAKQGKSFERSALMRIIEK